MSKFKIVSYLYCYACLFIPSPIYINIINLISVTSFSMNAEELREKAMARHKLGEHDEALAMLDEAIKADPKFARA